jgi:uncharacterized membrane protein
MKKTEKALISAAMAGILGALAAGSSMAADKMEKKAAHTDEVQCSGVNACKGKSSCAGANSSCASQNSCKGQGWVKVSKEACDQLGGKVEPKKS